MTDQLIPQQDLSLFLQELALIATKTVLPLFRTKLVVENKIVTPDDHRFDPVTQADKQCEAALRSHINQTYPDHGILGEEYGSENIDADYVWVLDPIDGTRAFISGLPLWGTLIGLNYKNMPLAGAMLQPFLGELFIGMGSQARLISIAEKNSKTRSVLKTRPTQRLEEATLFTTDPDLFNANEQKRYKAIETRCQLHRYGLDCYGYAMLAAGFADLVIEAGLKIYDIAPLVPLVEGAGGVVSDWQGNPVGSISSPQQHYQVIAAANPALHAVALTHLNR